MSHLRLALGQTARLLNPEKVVELTAPKVNEKLGYKFKAWNKQTKAKFTKDTTITAVYDELADVVPGDQAKPAGYSKVVFDLDDKGTTDNTKRFYVNPDKDVELVAPKVKANKGLKFTGWETDGTDWNGKVARKYASDTIITAKYTALENIEPADDEHPNPPSEDYVTVTFDKGEHGKSFEGTSKFYVKKNTDVDLSGKAPKVIPDEDYTFDKWDKPLTGKFNENATITALFVKDNNVIVPENPYDPVPTGYVKVTFDKGDKGDRLVGNRVFFVKKSTDMNLKSKAPVAIGIQGFVFKKWNADITALNLSKNTTITAIYEAMTQHKVVYEADGKVVGIEYLDNNASPDAVPSNLPEKSGYKFIGWQKNGSGKVYLEDALKKLKITEDTRFVARYEKEEAEKFIVSFEVDGVIKALEKVNKGGKVANVPEDPVASGKTFMGWKIDGKGAGYGKDAVKTLTIEKNTAFVASFRDDENVIPSNPTDPVKPGYAKVTFDKGAHGELKGNTVFQVKKDMEIDLTSEAPSVKPAEG